jgi:threonine/homoserine/homoserine lactone efflux protein
MIANKKRVALLFGFVLSVACLLYFFVDALHAAGRNNNDPFDVRVGTTAVTRSARVVGGLFCMLNIPSMITYVVLEVTLPHSLSTKMREGVVFSGVAVTVLGWWWFLALITRRKSRRRRAEGSLAR